MTDTAVKDVKEPKELFSPGHTACAGCGQALAARLVIEAAGPNTIVTNCTGCLEVFTTNYPKSAWNVPWIHSLFENSSAVASGVEMTLRALGKLDQVRVIAQGGDGGTADIGFGAISGMWERGHDVLYVCYDNEAYMNTGIQRSSLTPYDSNTTTSPPGKRSFGNPLPKKNMPEIAVAHGLAYVATASVAFPRDLQRKVKKALAIRGPKYLQIHVPCPLGWGHDPGLTFDIAKSVVETALYPLVEWEDGEITRVRQLKELRPVEDYLKPQRRFRHLFRPGAEEELEKVREIARRNARRYGLLKEEAKEAEAAAEPAPPAEAAPTCEGGGEAAQKVISAEELTCCDGKESRPAYVAYQGLVYDVTGSTSWEGGVHYDAHLAGRDLTQALEQAPHEVDLLREFPVVGRLAT